MGLKNYFIKFFKYFIDDKKSFFKYFILSFFVGGLELFGVALTYPFIMRILNSDGIDKVSAIIGALIITAFIAKNIFMIFYNSLQADFTKKCEAEINKKFMLYFLYGDYQTTSNISFAKKTQAIGFLSANAVNNFLLRILNLNVNIFIFVLITAFLFIKFFTATAITLAASLILLFSQAAFFKFKTAKISQKLNKSNEELNRAANEAMLNIKNIKIANSEAYFFEKYSQKTEDFKDISKELLFYNSIPPYVTEPFIIIILLILLAVISIQNINQTASLIASYALIVSAVFRLAPTISRIQVNLTGINTSLAQVKELIEYYEKFSLNQFNPTEKKYIEFKDSIELKDVCFAYTDKLVLKNINLKINKGDFIGIAGTSGNGKTTLVDIISGLLRIKTGELFVDGNFIRGTQFPLLKIGYIPQTVTITSASIRENVAFGTNEIDDDKVIEALKQAQLYDFIIENFKEGIYAKPFVDSTGFSEGQKQRIAIARALYFNPDILILDEATSSLDIKTEREILNVLDNLKGDKTIIAIAHRINTLKNCKKIILIKNSTLTNSGTFEELLEKDSDFQDIVRLNNELNSIHQI